MAQHEGRRPVTPVVKLSSTPFLAIGIACALASAAFADSFVGTEAADVLQVVGVLSHFANTEDVTEQNYAEAAKLWPEVIVLQPTSSVPHVQLALCLWRLNRNDEAKSECRRALELNPGDRRAAELLEKIGKP